MLVYALSVIYFQKYITGSISEVCQNVYQKYITGSISKVCQMYIKSI